MADNFDDLLENLTSADSKKTVTKKPTRRTTKKKEPVVTDTVAAKSTQAKDITADDVDTKAESKVVTIVELEKRIAALEEAIKSLSVVLSTSQDDSSNTPKKSKDGYVTFNFLDSGLSFLGEIREAGDVITISETSSNFAQVKDLVNYTPEQQKARWGKIFFTIS